MTEFGSMLEKATKNLQNDENKKFDNDKKKKVSRGEVFVPPEDSELFPPIMNRESPSKDMQYLMLGFCQREGKKPFHQFIVKYTSKKGDQYYKAKPEEIKLAIKNCGKRRSELKAIMEANNTHPIPFSYRGTKGHLVPLPDSEYAKKTANKRKRSRPVDSATSEESRVPSPKRPKATSPAVSDSDDELHTSFEKSYPNAAKRVSFCDPEDSDNDSGGCSETESEAELDAETEAWVASTKTLLGRSKIIKFINGIVMSNVDFFVHSFKKSKCLYSECITSKVLEDFINVQMRNQFAKKTPGMVENLLELHERRSKIPDSVVLAARKLFVQAVEDVNFMFLLDQENKPTFDKELLDPQEKAIYERMVAKRPKRTPYRDIVTSKSKMSRARIVDALFAEIDALTQTNRVLIPYRHLLLLVYVYGITSGFVTLSNAIICGQLHKHFENRSDMVTKDDLKKQGY